MNRQVRFIIVWAAITLMAAWFHPGTIQAQPAPANRESGNASGTRDIVITELARTLIRGPAVVPLGGEASLNMPQEFVFIPKTEAQRILKDNGGFPAESLLGIVAPADGKQWIIAVHYIESGFINDSDSKDIDAGKLLDAIKEQTDWQNEQRRRKGFSEVEILGWIEPPHYDPASHHLIWVMEAKAKGDASPDNTIAIYNTRILGREGYVSVTLGTSRSTLEANKRYLDEILSGLTFNQGRRYEDYNAKTDKTAKYGLIALIGGIAAHKLGFFALAGVFVAKMAKVLAIAAVGVLAAVKRIFRRNK